MSENIEYKFVENKKKTSNFMIDQGVKREFKIEVARNGDVMSSVLETLMISYIVKSRELHEKKVS
jgi:hypothetical protein